MSRFEKAVARLLLLRPLCIVALDSAVGAVVDVVLAFIKMGVLFCLDLVAIIWAAASPTVNMAAPEITFLRITAAVAAAVISAVGLIASAAQ